MDTATFGWTSPPPPSAGLTFKGAWNAFTNNPFLQSGVGVGGEYYIVSVAGTTDLDGTTDWQVGDWAIFESATNMWQKIDNHDIQSYTTIQNEGTNLTQESVLDFQGTGVTASNGAGKTIVTIIGIPPTNSFGLFAQTANSTPITATNVETTIIGAGVGTLTVPANGFSIGDSFQASLDGILSCVGTATLSIAIIPVSARIAPDNVLT